MGISPLNLPLLHNIIANFDFFGGLLFNLLYGFITLKISKKPTIHAILSLIDSMSYISFNITQLFSLITNHTGILNYFFEWLTLFLHLSHQIELSLYSIKNLNHFKKFIYRRQNNILKILALG